jgi:hypothetical protein
MRVSRPGSQILVVTECRLSHIGSLAICLVFFVRWYYALLDLGKIPGGFSKVRLWLAGAFAKFQTAPHHRRHTLTAVFS